MSKPEAWIYRYNGTRYVTLSEDLARQGVCPEPLYAATDNKLAQALSVLAWLDERGRNSRSFGSHADAYEIAARRLREALDAPPSKSFADIADDGPTAA